MRESDHRSQPRGAGNEANPWAESVQQRATKRAPVDDEPATEATASRSISMNHHKLRRKGSGTVRTPIHRPTSEMPHSGRISTWQGSHARQQVKHETRGDGMHGVHANASEAQIIGAAWPD